MSCSYHYQFNHYQCSRDDCLDTVAAPFVLAEYAYSKQLRALEELSSDPCKGLPPEACEIHTPLKPGVWQQLLEDHPDKWFANYIHRGIEQGFRIGFHGEQASLHGLPCEEYDISWGASRSGGQVPRRGKSRKQNCKNRGTRGSKGAGIQCSPFGVIPQKNRDNKWCLILDLSSPYGHSVNEGVRKDLETLSYISVDDVMAEILQRGRGTLLAKIDIKQAYRSVPVHMSTWSFPLG